MAKSTAAIAAAVLLLAGAVRAGEANLGGEGDRPWAHGVAPDEQHIALALFREGNALLKESVFVQAAAKYREALKHWDHPAIHYNLVLALLNLDQPLEVREHLVAALRYGAEPLDPEKYEQAKSYKGLVEKQLARVVVRCDEPGAQVVMDGRALFTAPGKYEDFIRPGPHTIVATKAGFLTQQATKALPAGELTSLDLKLMKATDLTSYRRRWSVAIPWAVVAGGAVVGLVGGGLHYGAAKSFQDFDNTVAQRGGSAPDSSLMSLRSRGNAMQGVAIGCYAVGGAALVAGAALVYVNRLQPYEHLGPLELDKDKQRQKQKPSGPSWSVAPLWGTDARGVQALIQF